MKRRRFLESLSKSALVLPLAELLAPRSDTLPFEFLDVTASAGLLSPTSFGAVGRNRYLLETTGCGVAFFDYDDDGWLDVFLVNGWRLEGFPDGARPSNRLFKNNRDGTFTDVTRQAGLECSGWGQGVCVGDYDNDGHEDLFVSYWGQNRLFRNNGDGTFSDVTAKAGLLTERPRWSSGCAFLDYDRDGHLDLFVANYLREPDKAPLPEAGPCLYKGLSVACGPSGLPGDGNLLYRNNGDGTFRDVSEQAGIRRTRGRFGLGVLVLDFDDDGWPDVFVANDSAPSSLFRNNRDGTFSDVAAENGCAYSADGKAQAGMGVAAADYDGDGWLDILKTNFSADSVTLYRNLKGEGCEDAAFPAGLGRNTRWLGWGCGFLDADNDGWPDAFLVNGHVYPEVAQLEDDAGYAQPKLLYRNLGNGRFEDVSARAGAAVTRPLAARGCAFGDFDNDGDVDVIINAINAAPQLLRCDARGAGHWLKLRLIGTKSNRSGIGARVRVRCGKRSTIDEVRSGGSYYSHSDMRLHFGLGRARQADLVEIRWPSGVTESFKDVPADRLIVAREGQGIVRSQRFPPA